MSRVSVDRKRTGFVVVRHSYHESGDSGCNFIGVLHDIVDIFVMFKLVLSLLQIGDLFGGETLGDEVPVFVAEVVVKGRASELVINLLLVIFNELVHSSFNHVSLKDLRSRGTL